MAPCKPLPKHKIALLTFTGLLVPVYFIPKTLAWFFPDQGLLSTALSVAAIVALMSYVIMPVLIWLFRGWIKQDILPNDQNKNGVIEQKSDAACQEMTKFQV